MAKKKTKKARFSVSRAPRTPLGKAIRSIRTGGGKGNAWRKYVGGGGKGGGLSWSDIPD
jgi:hypothetical protein